MKRRLMAVMASTAVTASVLIGIAGAGPARAATTTTISVPGAQPWTDTGIAVSTGDSVSITASGTIYIAGSDPGKTPAGAPGCVASATDTWVAPGLACWSMIGRIGGNPAFEVGTGTGFTATVGGELFLGVNDNYFPDNSGAWSATITITPPSTYAALGDSYSSGEGNSPYLAGTDTGTDQCHRSAAAYPELAAQQLGLAGGINFVACSGAFIQNQSIEDPDNEEQQQLSQLNSATKLVTLTIGGNNADFAAVMTACVTHPDCELLEEATVDQALAALGNNSPSNPVSLAQLYMKIAAAAPNATVLVVGYPRLFPALPRPLCATGYPGRNFNLLQMLWLNLKVWQLDNAIQNAVNQAAAAGANVKYVNAYNAFNGNELCTSNPDLYSVVQPVVGSFHPNTSGQAALARLVEANYP